MAIIFKEGDHSYTSTDGDNINWLSVTGIVKMFKQPFDDIEVANKCSKKKGGKYYGMTPEAILEVWADNSKRSTDLGTWYHKVKEDELLTHKSINRDGVELSIQPAIKKTGGCVLAPDQKLNNDTIYPEHLCYMKSARICGQSDEVEVIKSVVNIGDHKSSRKIDRTSVLLWNDNIKDKTPKMMTGIMSHLQDCEFNHYALQLSIYMYMCLRHNFNYTAGKLYINHVQFEEEGEDQFGNRIIKYDAVGDPIITRVNRIELPYMKDEVASIINYLKEQRAVLEQAA